MDTELELYKENTFENIKRIDNNGNEFWLGRELGKILEYSEYRKFLNTIEKAIIACKSSNQEVENHFVQVAVMVPIGSNAKRELQDYKLSRYACYLIVQNADSSKKSVALGQTYFAIQTRKQELLDEEIKHLNEDEKRLKIRGQVKEGNKTLNDTVYEIGARTNKEFAKFHNSGYKGLYGGEGINKIKERKGLSKSEDILDYMGSTELAANWFRITQTDEMIKKQKINNLDDANKTHNKVGREVRKTMKRLSGVTPEELPTPEKSIKQLEKDEKKKLKNSQKELLETK